MSIEPVSRPGFLDMVFPRDISDGATGGPEWSTIVVTASAGTEQRIQQWTRPRMRWDVSHAIKTPAEMSALVAFFYNTRGRAYSFRFQDPADFQAEGEPLEGSDPVRQLVKDYTFGGFTFRRTVKLVDASTFTLTRDGLDYPDFTLDDASGQVELTGLTDGTFTWSGEFFVEARFDVDAFSMNVQEWGIRNWEGIPIVELLR